MPLLLQGAFALAFLVVALALREPLTDDVFDGSETLYWVLVGSVLAYAASYFARGWLAGNQRFGAVRRLVLLESLLALPVPARGRDRDPRGPVGGRAGHPRRAARLAGRRAVGAARAGTRGDAAAPDDRAGPSLRAGRRLRARRSSRCMLAEQTIINAPVLHRRRDRRATRRWRASSSTSCSSPARRCSSSRRSRPRCSPTSPALERDRGPRRVRAARSARRCWRSRRSRARSRSGCSCSARGRWTCSSAATSTTAAGASRSSRSAWAATSPPARSTRPRSPAGASAPPRPPGSPPPSRSSSGSLLPVVDDELLRVEVGYLGATALLCALLAVIERRAARASV